MSSYVWYVGLFALFQNFGILSPLFFRSTRKMKNITYKMLVTYILVSEYIYRYKTMDILVGNVMNVG